VSIIRRNNCVSPDDGHIVPRNMFNKYTKNKYTKDKLCIKLALFVRLYREARSTKHKKFNNPRLPGQQSSRHVAQTHTHTNINTCLNLTHVVATVVEES